MKIDLNNLPRAPGTDSSILGFVPGHLFDEIPADERCERCSGVGAIQVPVGCFSAENRRCPDCYGSGKAGWKIGDPLPAGHREETG